MMIGLKITVASSTTRLQLYRSLPTTTNHRLFSTTTSQLVKALKNGLPDSYTYSQSFKIWMSSISNRSNQDQVSQDDLLRFTLPYYNKKIDNIIATNLKTKIPRLEKVVNESYGHEDIFLNEIRLENFNEPINGNKDTHHLVMLHGYAASGGWWFKNLDGLIKASPNTKIYNLDMLGFGISSKPSISYKNDRKNKFEIKFDKDNLKSFKHIHKSLKLPNTFSVNIKELKKYLPKQMELITEVENIYIDSLEQWRIATGLKKFDLMGHSLGGYMALSYALKYPDSVNRLVLVSPGGIERTPLAVSNPKYKELVSSSTDGEEIEFKSSHWPGDYGFLGRYPAIRDSFKLFWNHYYSAFTLLRLIGPLGPKVLSQRNINKLTRSGSISNWSEIDLFMKYMYHTTTKKSFSETSIMRIFDASVVARWPMLDRLNNMKVDKSLWIYGEHDFMFNDCGKAATGILNGGKDREQVGGHEFEVVSNAGHNLYLDNYKEFNEKVLKFLKY